MDRFKTNNLLDFFKGWEERGPMIIAITNTYVSRSIILVAFAITKFLNELLSCSEIDRSF